MKEHTIVNEADGQIQSVFYGTGETAELQVEPRESFLISGNYPDDQYYFDKTDQTMREQPDIPAELSKDTLVADGQDSIVISGLPTDDLNGNAVETEVRINRHTYQVPDGELEFTVNAPGLHRISCRATNHKPFETKVEAIDDES